MCQVLTLLTLLPWSPVVASAQSANADDAYERAFLKEHGVKAEAAELLSFFRSRTLDDDKIKHIRELIKQMGSPRFAVRDKASKELLTFGVSALRYVEAATRDADIEISQRAGRIVDEIRNGPGPSLPIAALRQLRKAAGTLRVPSAESVPAALLAYLPFADDRTVEDEVLISLVSARSKDASLFIEAAESRLASQRSAAGYVLGRGKDQADREIARKLLKDPDPWVCLRAAEGLLAGLDRAALPAYIALLHPNHEEVTARTEEMLRRIAGDKSPAYPVDEKPETRAAYQKAWADWWKKSEKEVDLANLPKDAPVLGLYIGIEYNTNLVWESGRDGKRRWTVTAQGPMDAQVLPGNRVLIAEQSAKRVSERDFKGNILWEFATDEETLNCRRLPNGNTWIGTRKSIMEVRPNKTIVYKHQIDTEYFHGVRRLSNGNSVGITSMGVIHEISPMGKTLRKVTLTHEGTWGDVDALPNGRFLVTNYGTGFVREVDNAGKIVRQVKVPDACGVDILSNGQLLVSGQSIVKIVDWTGKVFWETSSDGCVRRIHLR